MTTYLIDFENVRSEGLTGIETLGKDDKVCIFYSANAESLTFEAHKKIMASQANVSYFRVHRGGKNALDFQLSSYLGFLISTDSCEKYYIVSNDNGFNFVLDFWFSNFKDRKVCLFRAISILQAVNSITQIREESNEDTEVINAETVYNEAEKTERNTGLLKVNVFKKNRNMPKNNRHVMTVKPSTQETKQEVKPEAKPEVKQSECKEPDNIKKQIEIQIEPPVFTAVLIPPKPKNFDVIKDKIANLVGEECNEDTTAQLAGFVLASSSKQELYRSILRKFGQKRGIEIYKLIRQEYSNLRKLA